jgi:hypothetical protein
MQTWSPLGEWFCSYYPPAGTRCLGGACPAPGVWPFDWIIPCFLPLSRFFLHLLNCPLTVKPHLWYLVMILEHERDLSWDFQLKSN